MKMTGIVLNASIIARLHTYLATSAFLSALLLGLLLHYKKIVKNSVAAYPDEWFPSVSSTIGDWYPERSIFQILIALTSGPRICLVLLQYHLHGSSALSTVVLISGLIRTLSCGGWVYITSSDDHDIHDFFMIVYIVLNLPWMIGGIFNTSPKYMGIKKKRKLVAAGFFGLILPLIYFFIQHKVYRIPGAYTRYSFFEWGLISCDIFYDSFSEHEFKLADLQISIGSKLVVEARKQDTASHGPPVSHLEPATVEAHKSGPRTDSSWLKAIKQQRERVSFLSDVYLSYIFWSLFTSLIPTLFYFSIWQLGFAGHELALLSTISPALTAIPGFLSWIQTRGGQTTLRAISFVGLLAYALPKPIHRLLLMSLATSAAMLHRVGSWRLSSGVQYQSLVTALGLVLSSLSKHANHSNNPVWPMVNERSGGYNKTGIAFALFALYEFSTRPRTGAHRSERRAAPLHWLRAAIPLGTLIFILHTFLAESSTLVAWSWRGYENRKPRGPLPHLHSSLTIISQCIGILISILPESDSHLSHPAWFLYGLSSCYVLHRSRDWSGYIGGLNFACFATSIIPLVLHRASLAPYPARTYSVAMIVYSALVVGHTFTVAYAFVPGGTYLRERTDLIMLICIASISLTFRWFDSKAHPSSVPVSSSSVSHAKSLMALICTLSVLATVYRLPSGSIQPWKPGHRLFRAGIWTLHFGFDNAGRDSQRGVHRVIEDMELDIVGLLETDLNRIVFGNRDLTRIAAERGYYVDLGPGPNLHTWGAVLLSKFPIVNTTHHLLPSPRGELAPAIEAVLDVFGTLVTVVVAHNGQEEDPLDRELQSTELARIMSSSPHPVLFLGYVVTKPGAKRPSPYEILTEDGRMHDIDVEDKDRWCEYVLYRGLYRTAYARVSRGSITDTEVQIGQFVLPKHGQIVSDESHAARYLRTVKEGLPEHHWFPMEYYNNYAGYKGVNGHFYHVFNTPLYYKIPEDAVL